jgi:hypothetical protein
VEVLNRTMIVVRRFGRYLSTGAVLLNLAAGSLAAVSAAQAADGYSEDAVKAAYLYRFAGYVDWPDEGPANAPFTIAVLGSRSIARELRRLLPSLPLNHRPAEVREVTGVRDLKKPQILYVGAGHADFLRATPTRGHPMLLVTDEEGGLEAGSVLNFLVVDHRVRFEVSLTAADRARLRISSELLTVAVRVRGGGRQARGGGLPPAAPHSEGDCAFPEAHRLQGESKVSSGPHDGRGT